jgi:alanyl-tRNA synthetase
MDMKTSNELRQFFLDYFAERGHEIVPTSPLVPGNDPTLLFTNAGMVQFKDVFLGTDKRPYVRATTAQRCVRAGGKHNDLDNVGYTARHHTFFEMLGNFSFGDYFKREAIEFSWELLTDKLGLAPERLWVTVFEEDDEAADIWLQEIGVDGNRFSRCGLKDNFWSMGDTGPCGPCSEVFYDHGPEVAGGPPGSPDEDGDRYIELWNLVFMQFNRDAQGNTTPLPKPSVDTGMGLERLAAVMQGVHSNYEIDLFRSLIEAAAEVTGADDLDDKSLRVIADHIRSSAFLVVDGVVPDREGRGYVLRRIIRRAIRHGHKLGVTEPFFHRLVAPLEKEMGLAYPELGERRELVERVLEQEEERFAKTLQQGMRLLEQAIDGLSGDRIPGETLFKLYDTYGFPADLTADVARERGLGVDVEGFEREMEGQRQRGKGASKFQMVGGEGLEVACRSDFHGYDTLSAEGRVQALILDGKVVERLGPEDQGVVILDRTPFYGEAGGQVGDRGVLAGGTARFEVHDTQHYGEALAHLGVLTDGEIRVGDGIEARVDADAREATARNHSATHLLHAALRQLLGEHVQQKGSLVAPDRLRFDFSHFEPVSAEQLADIERRVNEWTLDNDGAVTREMPLAEAMQSGAVALFGEKYDDPVRVLSIGEHSTELCGGTHVQRAGDIGLFKITSETSIAAGVRRVEAVTGTAALDWLAGADRQIAQVVALLKSDRAGLVDKVGQVMGRTRELEQDLERLKARLALSHGDDLAAQAVDMNGLKVLAAKLDGVDAKGLRATVDQLKSKLGSAAVVLASVEGEKVSLVAGVTADYVDRIEAGPLANFVAQQVGGRGGGRPDLAQAGGNDPARLDQAIKAVPNWVRERLGS